jgi:hypothetical protein
MTREEAYAEIGRIAEEHALIAQAFGGVITVVHPDVQREHGIEAKCLYMAGQGPWPSNTQQAPEQQPAQKPVPDASSREEQTDLFDMLDAEQQEGAE